MDILDLKKRQKIFYKSIVSIYCPILNDTVYFTSEGFNHLVYDSHRIPRKIGEQYMKLQCLKYVPTVINNCTEVKVREINKRIKGNLKSGTHSALVCEVSRGIEIRVIIEKIGTGKYKFLSVMPHNNKSKNNSKTKKHPRKGAA